MNKNQLAKLIAYLANAIHAWNSLKCDQETALGVAGVLAGIVDRFSGVGVIAITEADLMAAEPLTPVRALTAWIDLAAELGTGLWFYELEYEEAAMLDDLMVCDILELPGAVRWDDKMNY